jgi:predicted transcriptional regulator
MSYIARHKELCYKHSMAETTTSSITLRITKSMEMELDRIAREQKRSRSYVMKEAFAHYVSSEKPQIKAARKPFNLEHFLKFAGSGVTPGTERTVEEIDADIRWLRGDD